jgi:hypothetical protein
MAKRYYNLEKETKDYLKACEVRNITPIASTKTVNDFCIAQKNLGQALTTSQLIEYSYLPNIWLDSTIPSSYPSISRNWINLANRNSNITLPATFQYNNSYNGSLFLNYGQATTVAWNANGITSDFTIDSWVTFLSGAGPYASAMFINEVYLTRGFRSGLNAQARRYSFWDAESLPSGTPNGFTLNTPINSITYGVPVNITLTFNTALSTASIFLNGNVSASANNRAYIPPTGSSNLTINTTLNGTNNQIYMHNLKVYNRALSASEINTTYNLVKGRFGL